MNFEAGEVLLVDKPMHWTSFDVVNKLRYAISRKAGKRLKVGHAGTLDPLAIGLLIICTGKKTKEIDRYTGMTKEYTGTMHLGATTPTYDAESEPDNTFSTEHITSELIEKVRHSFVGEQDQIPPMYSAVKVDGKVAYNQARKGKELELKPRRISIEEFVISKIDLPHVDFRVVCSKGTYIRSLVYDFGKKLNSGAYLQTLCRTRIGEFELKNALSVQDWVKKIETNTD